MKQNLLKSLLIMACILYRINISAYDFEVDGIYYNITSIADKTVEVTNGPPTDIIVNPTGEVHLVIQSSNAYSGDIVIPSSVQYQNYTFNVTAIGRSAFHYCEYLTTIKIPNSITKIGEYAFCRCKNLATIEIPNSITEIGMYGFSQCGLKTIKIPNNVKTIGLCTFTECSNLIAIELPNNIESIEDAMFQRCSNLTTVNIPNSVTEIGVLVFSDCTSLTVINIPNNVTSIGHSAFMGCSSLTTINIPNSLTEINGSTFSGCNNLTTIDIPYCITKIGGSAFFGCNSLTTINIPYSIIEIGDKAFDSCANLMQINCLATNPPKIGNNTFTINQRLFSTLNVPESCTTDYRNAEYWKDFVNIVENGKPVETKKCETPTISYVAGKLKFSSNTEGAEFHYTLTNKDVKNSITYSDGTVNLDACYCITAYTTAEGYLQSEPATATLYWINANIETTNINKVTSRGVVASCNNGVISISGLTDGESIKFYSIDGKLIGSQQAYGGEVQYAISNNNNIVIAKIGDNAIKIAMK